MHDIFLSYSRTDTEIMQSVKQSFKDAGLSVWTDEGIEPGTASWTKAIENAVDDAQMLVCICSPEAKDSRWVQAEINRAEMRKKIVYLILARGDELDAIPFGYNFHQYTDIRNRHNYDKAIKILIARIRDKLGIAETLLPAPFDWIEIPTGKVTLEEGGYIPNGGQNYDVPTFYIAKYPITNAQFAKFIGEGGYNQKKWWTDFGWQLKENESLVAPRYWNNTELNGSEQPVVGVSWYEAVAFCLWMSDITGEKIMLSTEQQWQRAAQGNDDRIYPWGNQFDKSRANTESGIGRTTPVTQYEGKGDSPFGVIDMSGNTFEWCLTDYDTGTTKINYIVAYRVLRGSSFLVSISAARTTSRYYNLPDTRYDYRGFRISASKSP